MTQEQPYQYAVLRYVPNVFVQEFANIGIVMLLPESGEVKFHLDKRTARLSHFFLCAFDAPSYRRVRDQAEHQIRKAIKALGPQPDLWERDLESLLPRLLAHDPSSFQWSPPSGGLDQDPDQVFQELIKELLSPQESTRRPRHEPEAMWREVERLLEEQHLQILSEVTIEAKHYDYTFKGAWKNGKLQLLEPISFDYLEPTEMRDQANKWTGRLTNLSSSDREFALTAIVCGPESPELQAAFEDSLAMLRESKWVRNLVRLEDFEETMVPTIRQEARVGTAEIEP